MLGKPTTRGSASKSRPRSLPHCPERRRRVREQDPRRRGRQEVRVRGRPRPRCDGLRISDVAGSSRVGKGVARVRDDHRPVRGAGLRRRPCRDRRRVAGRGPENHGLHRRGRARERGGGHARSRVGAALARRLPQRSDSAADERPPAAPEVLDAITLGVVERTWHADLRGRLPRSSRPTTSRCTTIRRLRIRVGCCEQRTTCCRGRCAWALDPRREHRAEPRRGDRRRGRCDSRPRRRPVRAGRPPVSSRSTCSPRSAIGRCVGAPHRDLRAPAGPLPAGLMIGRTMRPFNHQSQP